MKDVHEEGYKALHGTLWRVIIVGFNITGGVIDVGEGPIMEIVYISDPVFETQVVALNVSEFYFGDWKSWFNNAKETLARTSDSIQRCL